MPNYDFLNTVTGDTETHTIKMAEYDAFVKDNPSLQRKLTTVGMVSQAKETLAKTSEDWRKHLKNIKNNNGAGTDNIKTY